MKTVAVLTGATGGLGKAFLQELLQEELDEIWAVARDPRKLEALCAAFGEKVVPVRCDLCVSSEVEGFVALLKACSSESENPRHSVSDQQCRLSQDGAHRDLFRR